MNKQQYQAAFSRLEPSEAAVEQVLHLHEPKRRAQRSFRPVPVLVAAALAAALLSGSVFAAAHFHWFSLTPMEPASEPVSEQTVDPDRLDDPARQEDYPDPKSQLALNGEIGGAYIGFTLPDSYQQTAFRQECRKLTQKLAFMQVSSQATLDGATLNSAYCRYYGCTELQNGISPWGDLLTVEILETTYNDYPTYLMRWDATLVKEGEINGVSTAWLEFQTLGEIPVYCLLQNNEALGCMAAICSNRSFELAEQAARDMVYVDSGAPRVPQTEIVHGLHTDWVPEGRELDVTVSMEKYLNGATLADPKQDLKDVYLQYRFRIKDGIPGASFVLLDNVTKFGTDPDDEVVKRGSVAGHEAVWLRDQGGEGILQVWFEDAQVQLNAYYSYEEEEAFPGDVEAFIEHLEIVDIPILALPPRDFAPFSVG